MTRSRALLHRPEVTSLAEAVWLAGLAHRRTLLDLVDPLVLDVYVYMSERRDRSYPAD